MNGYSRFLHGNRIVEETGVCYGRYILTDNEVDARQ